MWDFVKSDLYRYEGCFTWKLFFRNFFFNPSFKFTFFCALVIVRTPLLPN